MEVWTIRRSLPEQDCCNLIRDGSHAVVHTFQFIVRPAIPAGVPDNLCICTFAYGKKFAFGTVDICLRYAPEDRFIEDEGIGKGPVRNETGGQITCSASLHEPEQGFPGNRNRGIDVYEAGNPFWYPACRAGNHHRAIAVSGEDDRVPPDRPDQITDFSDMPVEGSCGGIGKRGSKYCMPLTFEQRDNGIPDRTIVMAARDENIGRRVLSPGSDTVSGVL
jgi:hypothetical protein